MRATLFGIVITLLSGNAHAYETSNCDQALQRLAREWGVASDANLGLFAELLANYPKSDRPRLQALLDQLPPARHLWTGSPISALPDLNAGEFEAMLIVLLSSDMNEVRERAIASPTNLSIHEWRALLLATERGYHMLSALERQRPLFASLQSRDWRAFFDGVTNNAAKKFWGELSYAEIIAKLASGNSRFRFAWEAYDPLASVIAPLLEGDEAGSLRSAIDRQIAQLRSQHDELRRRNVIKRFHLRTRILNLQRLLAALAGKESTISNNFARRLLPQFSSLQNFGGKLARIAALSVAIAAIQAAINSGFLRFDPTRPQSYDPVVDLSTDEDLSTAEEDALFASLFGEDEIDPDKLRALQERVRAEPEVPDE